MEEINQEHMPNILLVHGGFGDGSRWGEVIEFLQFRGFNVVASQLPFTCFDDDVRAVERDLGALEGPTAVVAHSYGGLVATQAASGKDNVCGLVYVAALAVDRGETPASIAQKYPTPAAQFFELVDPDENPPFLLLRRDKIPEFSCPDLFRRDAAVIAATAGPVSSTLLTAKINTEPAWRKVPTWYLMFSEDQILRPDGQRDMAERAAPPEHIDSVRASHLGMLSRPQQVARFIKRAADECADSSLRSSNSAPVSTRLG